MTNTKPPQPTATERLRAREEELRRSIAKRLVESGAELSAVDAMTEFNHSFPEIHLGVREATNDQLAIHVAMLEELDNWLADRKRHIYRPAGVIISGQTGTGKTALACLLAKQAAALAGLRPSFISCRRMRDDLRGLPSQRRRGHEDYLDAADPKDWPVLVIDDACRERGNAVAQDLVRGILDDRTQASCFTIWTTNHAATTQGDVVGFFEHLGGDREARRASCLRWLDTKGLPEFTEGDQP